MRPGGAVIFQRVERPAGVEDGDLAAVDNDGRGMAGCDVGGTPDGNERFGGHDARVRALMGDAPRTTLTGIARFDTIRRSPDWMRH